MRLRLLRRAGRGTPRATVAGDFVLKSGDLVAGKYQIIDALGVGGSGAVYRAQKVGMKQRVALKMMHAEHPDGDVERQRFQREAELVKKLQHPHIVRLMDYGHDDHGVPYLAFALLEGQPLDVKIKKEGALEYTQVGRFSQQILRALDKAHSLDVVHRDIKPANIFLSSGVLGEVVQMLDFGLAKIVHDAPGALEVTRAGSVLGTPRYMAPEQVRGEKVGPTADIYAAGLLMCEMLLGRPLVGGSQDIEIYVTQGSDREHELPPEILNSPFASIVQRAVAKPLNVRYRQASQMLADVNAVVEALSGGEQVMSEADMEATFVMDSSQLQALSTPTASSDKLRKAFNAMADKQARDAAKAQRAAAEPPLSVTRPPTSSNGAAAAAASASARAPASVPPSSANHGPKIVVNAPAGPLESTSSLVDPTSQAGLARAAQHPGQPLAQHAHQQPGPAYAQAHAGNMPLHHTHASANQQAGTPASHSGPYPQAGSPASHSGPYPQAGMLAPTDANGAQLPQVTINAKKSRVGLIIAATCLVVATAAGLAVWFLILS